jgi:hypothetical protein
VGVEISFTQVRKVASYGEKNLGCKSSSEFTEMGTHFVDLGKRRWFLNRWQG